MYIYIYTNPEPTESPKHSFWLLLAGVPGNIPKIGDTGYFSSRNIGYKARVFASNPINCS